jgi:membrane-associated protein
MDQLLAIFRDLPGFLDGFIQNHGAVVYALLFAIVFCETGLVVTPFLPGDSLLFTCGALAARGSFNIVSNESHVSVLIVAALLFAAAVLGNTCNYWIGRFIGPRVFKYDIGGQDARAHERRTLLERLLNRKHLARAHAFFEKYGGKAVIMGQFVPIVRTFCPFVAGAGAMTYRKFILFNIIGATLWVGICVGAGWFFGNFEWVKKNFEAVVVAIIVISLVPMAIEFVMHKRKARATTAAQEGTH